MDEVMEIQLKSRKYPGRAYDKAAREAFGPYARTNFSEGDA